MLKRAGWFHWFFCAVLPVSAWQVWWCYGKHPTNIDLVLMYYIWLVTILFFFRVECWLEKHK